VARKQENAQAASDSPNRSRMQRVVRFDFADACNLDRPIEAASGAGAAVGTRTKRAAAPVVAAVVLTGAGTVRFVVGPLADIVRLGSKAALLTAKRTATNSCARLAIYEYACQSSRTACPGRDRALDGERHAAYATFLAVNSCA